MAELAREILQRRVADLDAIPAQSPGAAAVDHDLAHAARVMASYTNTATSPASINADRADEVVRSCRLLTKLAITNPAVVAGSLDRSCQHWTSTRRLSTEPRRPAADQFVAVADLDQTPSVQPRNMGLYTSTSANKTGLSMWRHYLEPYRGSDLYPGPWTTWSLSVDVTTPVAEIGSAAAWVEFVSTYPVEQEGLIYIDWAAAAAEVGGVHITLQALAAIQSLMLETCHGPTAPMYWDVESTLWLAWHFTDALLIEVTD